METIKLPDISLSVDMTPEQAAAIGGWIGWIVLSMIPLIFIKAIRKGRGEVIGHIAGKIADRVPFA